MITSLLVAPFVLVFYILGLALIVGVIGGVCLLALYIPFLGVVVAIGLCIFGIIAIIGWTGTCIGWVCDGIS